MPFPVPDDPTLVRIVSQACRAPSVHNTQPWRWVVSGRELRLHADQQRRLVYADPGGRDLVISCGAALHQLQVAAAAEGWATHVHRMPDPRDPDLLAAVTFQPHQPTPEEVELGQAIAHRRTDRRAVTSWPVPPSRLESMRQTAGRYGVVAVAVTSEPHRHLLRSLLEASIEDLHLNDRYLDELLAWTQTRRPEGVPEGNLVSRRSVPAGEIPPRFPSGTLPDEYDEGHPPAESWLVLATSSDDTLSWLRAGEALAAIWLRCTVEGLLVVPASAPMEVEAARARLQEDLLDDTACPQMLLQVGWPPPAREPVPETPRRNIEEVLHL